MKPICFVSGKYSEDTKEGKMENIKIAYVYAQELWKLGYWCFVPHLNCGLLEEHTDVQYIDVLTFCITVLEACDCVYMLPNWVDSFGANTERAHALKAGIPVIYSLEEAEKWIKRNSTT